MLTLAETLGAVGMSQVELARRANRPPQVISEIIVGKKEITPETAIEFERVLGVPAHIWLNLEAQFRMVRARLAEAKRLEEELPLAAKFPYADMAKLGWVPKLSDLRQRAEALLRFFGVATLKGLEYVATWRRANLPKVSDYALAAWLRRGEIEAQAIHTRPFDESAVASTVTALRRMTCESPDVFNAQLSELFRTVGIVLVCVPHLPRTGAQGATRWVAGRPIVQLSVRYRWADIFWFTLFHELCHVFRHGKKGFFVDFLGQGGGDPQEVEADRFAVGHLIPEAPYRRFLADTSYTSAARVRAFAATIGVHPGIVVGRLQHDRRIGADVLNGLRARYELQKSTKPESEC